jgi:nucleoside phosphorylase/tetratricopeptide (TPR) repeat protein
MAEPRSPVWMVPRRRDPHFVGREEELDALRAALAMTGTSALTQPAAVHGLGGVGKTLLAVEYAHRHGEDYSAVLWLNAENSTALAAAFADLARELDLPEADDPDPSRRVAAVLRWLSSPAPKPWLLVFDNAERREDVDPYVPRRHAGHVLITSRNPDWTPLAKAISVRPLPRARSIEMLRQGLPGGDDAEADGLAETLGDLPLALAQAAAFLRETGCGFADYLEQFRSRGEVFDREQAAEPGSGRTVAVTLALALDRLREAGNDMSPAELVLARCAFYAPTEIPRELLEDELADVKALNAAIKVLRSYSLVETTADGTVTVHRLVQRAVRERLPADTRVAFAAHAVRKLLARFPRPADDAGNWSHCRELLDHALDAIDHAASIDGAARNCAELLNQVGIYLSASATLGKAREVLERAVRLKEAAYGRDHPEVAITLGNLGNVVRGQGDLAEARRLQEWALRLKQSAYGPNHPEVARTLVNLGLVARSQGKHAEACRLLERALRLFETAHGLEHLEVALTLTNLGLVARDRGDLAEARRLYGRALDLFRAALGEEHSSTAQARGVLEEILSQTHVAPPSAPSGGIMSQPASPPQAKTQPASPAGSKPPAPTVGILTALDHEFVAMKAMLDGARDYDIPGADLRYVLGEIPGANGTTHAVVLTLGDMGESLAAVHATQLLGQFPTLKWVLMVGIAGGIPNPDRPDDHVRLGDLVVSDKYGVVQYDAVKQTAASVEVRAAPRPPSAKLLQFVRHLNVKAFEGSYPWEAHIRRGLTGLGWSRPPDTSDLLAGTADPKLALEHPADPKRRPGQPRVFLGLIASSNTLLKDPVKRDALRDQFRAKAIEMETAGLADAAWTQETGYLGIRGICDYCDGNKNDLWQPYTAVAAAAYARALLESIPGAAVPLPR